MLSQDQGWKLNFKHSPSKGEVGARFCQAKVRAEIGTLSSSFRRYGAGALRDSLAWRLRVRACGASRRPTGMTGAGSVVSMFTKSSEEEQDIPEMRSRSFHFMIDLLDSHAGYERPRGNRGSGYSRLIPAQIRRSFAHRIGDVHPFSFSSLLGILRLLDSYLQLSNPRDLRECCREILLPVKVNIL
jgi:hypothetical protein